MDHDLGARARWRRWRLTVTAGLTAAVVAASIAVAFVQGIEADRSRQRLRQAEAADRAVAAVLSAPDARTVHDPVPGGGAATVIMSRSSGQMVFASQGLDRLPASKVYQLWLMGTGPARSAGLLRPDAAGRTAPVLARRLVTRTRWGSPSNPPPDPPSPRRTRW